VDTAESCSIPPYDYKHPPVHKRRKSACLETTQEIKQHNISPIQGNAKTRSVVRKFDIAIFRKGFVRE
jgi:hypothetical protein